MPGTSPTSSTRSPHMSRWERRLRSRRERAWRRRYGRTRLPRAGDYSFSVFADGRLVAILGNEVVWPDDQAPGVEASRYFMVNIMAAIPAEIRASARLITVRNAFWSMSVPACGPDDHVAATGARLMHFDMRLDILRDRQRGMRIDRERGGLDRVQCRRPRTRGAGRPRSRRVSTRSCAQSGDSGDDGPPGHQGPAGGRTRHSIHCCRASHVEVQA